MGNIEQLSNLDNILSRRKTGAPAMELLFVDGKCLENSESVGFHPKPPSSELELSVNEAPGSYRSQPHS